MKRERIVSLLFAIGSALLCHGVWMIYKPASWIVAGALLMTLSFGLVDSE